jgi:uncharacterized Fe-S cluster-containing radical SAM superfamily protein
VTIDPTRLARSLRAKLVRCDTKQVLISRLAGSLQERDIAGGVNCQGYGRLRTTDPVSTTWSFDTTVPNEPAATRLGLSSEEARLSQLFQLAGCNLRCWFCYVDGPMLTASPGRAQFLSADDLVRMYMDEPVRARIVTLTGGQPDLVPEWLPWMMQSLRKRGLEDDVFLWMDDNLTTDFAWRCLGHADWALIRGWRNFAKVACFKSFCGPGFAENTGAAPQWFASQLACFERLHRSGIDLYGYIILTITDLSWVSQLPLFMDRLQRDVHENILLRITPLEIKLYGPTKERMSPADGLAVKNQYRVLELWNEELERRYPASMRSLAMSQVPLG